MLILGLPASSATVRALRDGAEHWGAAEHLAAAMVDELRVANWLFVERHKRQGASNPFPDRVPRPGAGQLLARPAEKPRQATVAEVKAFFSRN